MFNYFHANENEQYLFLQMPLMLIKDEQFKGLSDSAKILYSLLLNRTSLSAKNGWTDAEGRVYIIYTVEEIMSDLNCWKEKATKSMKELKEIGLVESVRQGLGKPNIIYVMNFATVLKYKAKDEKNPQTRTDTQKFGKRTSGVSKIELQDGLKIEPQQVRKSNSIYNDSKKIYSSDIDYNHIESNLEINRETEKEKTDTIRLDKMFTQTIENEEGQKNKESLKNATSPSVLHLPKPSADRHSIADVEEIIKENIDYDYILMDNPTYKELLDGVLHVIVSTITAEFKGGYISMGEESVPAEEVKSIFFKLTKDDIEYFIENFNRQTKPTVKLTPYIRTSLYRNYGTNDFYWANRVHVDMPYVAEPKIQSKTE